MTKTLSLVLVALLLMACGGSPFEGTSEPLAGAGGDGSEAGTAAATAGGSEALIGGSGNAAGGSSAATAGSGHGGRPSGGAGAGTGGVGSGGGGTPAACEFDVTQLTASLPSTVTWEDFIYTDGALCVTCRDKPCGTIHVISWGVPQLLEDGRYLYLPNAEMPMIAMNLGANDGACTTSTVCGIKMSVEGLQVAVEQRGSWVITQADSAVAAAGNMCASSAGFSNTYPP